MTPLEELRAGALGEAFVKLLYREFAQVGIRYRFPPPTSYASWTADAAIEAAHDFLTDGKNYPRLVELAAKVGDDIGLERMLAVVVRNHLRATGRRTVLGKLIRRLRNLLPTDPRFEVVPERTPGAGNIALAGGPTDPYAGPPSPLRDAARAVAGVTIVRWGPTARREGPVADGPSLLVLSAAVLEAAAGSLPFPDLAEFIAVRLGIDPSGVPGTLPVDDIDYLTSRESESASPGAGSAAAATAALGRSLEDDEVAGSLLEEFSERERLVLAWLHLTVRGIADATGLAVSTAGAVSQRVRDKLARQLSGLDDGSAERIAVAVRDAARAEFGLDQI